MGWKDKLKKAANKITKTVIKAREDLKNLGKKIDDEVFEPINNGIKDATKEANEERNKKLATEDVPAVEANPVTEEVTTEIAGKESKLDDHVKVDL